MKPRPVLIGIAGGSGSGKTYLARRVREQAGPEKVAMLSMDQYFTSEGAAGSPAHINFDHPQHLKLRLLIRHLRWLKAGRHVQAPQYDFKTRRQGPEPVQVEPK